MIVQCPKCKRTDTYVTTYKYDPDIPPNGSMVKLKNPNHKGGWTFGNVRVATAAVTANYMECCDCGGLLTFGGKMIVLPDDYKAPNTLTREEKNQAVIDSELQDMPEQDQLIVEEMGISNEVEVEIRKAQLANASDVTCNICGKMVKNASGLSLHKRQAHKIKP